MKIFIVSDSQKFNDEIIHKYPNNGFMTLNYRDNLIDEYDRKLWMLQFLTDSNEYLDWSSVVIFDPNMSDKVTLYTLIGKMLISRKSYMIYEGGKLENYLNFIRSKSITVSDKDDIIIRELLMNKVIKNYSLTINNIDLDWKKLIQLGIILKSDQKINIKINVDDQFLNYYTDQLNTI